ncbi:hypothetical protein C8Q74DRAFT_181899 [Fomes fomentarius]|nr:hypothetical protein C8Q74DRAFT_181899 [Fomes fomentarius]
MKKSRLSLGSQPPLLPRRPSAIAQRSSHAAARRPRLSPCPCSRMQIPAYCILALLLPTHSASPTSRPPTLPHKEIYVRNPPSASAIIIPSRPAIPPIVSLPPATASPRSLLSSPFSHRPTVSLTILSPRFPSSSTPNPSRDIGDPPAITLRRGNHFRTRPVHAPSPDHNPYFRLFPQSSEVPCMYLFSHRSSRPVCFDFGVPSSTAGITLLAVSYDVRLRLMPHEGYRVHVTE